MSGLRNGGPAFPGITVNDTDGNLTDPFGTLLPPNGQAAYSGMSLRAYAAAHVLQGFAAEPNTDGDPALIADVAVRWADALIARLES